MAEEWASGASEAAEATEEAEDEVLREVRPVVPREVQDRIRSESCAQVMEPLHD